MNKSDIENSLAESESQKVELSQQLQEIADRIEYLIAERKSLAFPLKEKEPEAVARAKKIENEIARLREKQEKTALQLSEVQDMIEAFRDDLRAAEFGEAQLARDRAALATIEGWIKLFELRQEEQETADEIDRRKAEARDAETKLNSLAVRDCPEMIPYDPPVEISELPNRIADLHRRRAELMTRLGM